MKIAMTGASGFVGTALREAFRRHVEFVIIERDDDAETIVSKLDGVEVAINLAGAPIIKRWSDPYKEVLLQSRIRTTRKLVDALEHSSVKHLISTSAVGIYPDNVKCSEKCTDYSVDFLGRLATQWEAEARRSLLPTTILRFGVVLGSDGGALQQMLTPFKLGVGGPIGNGKMVTSWIDIDDLVRIYRFVIEHRLTGTFNAVSPHPVTNKVFSKALGKALHRPAVLPIPEFALKLMYGEASTVLTGSKEVYPEGLIEAGFRFEYPRIDASLEHIVGP